jgi:cell wall-associated NlpC family hydrolase
MSAVMLDPRRHAFRADLAAEDLRGRVEASRYVAGERRQVAVASTPVRGTPDARAIWTTEALFGEAVRVFDERDGWAWVQLEQDGYVGYLQASALSRDVHAPTHRVSALGTCVYATANAKAEPSGQLPMNARVGVTEANANFARLAQGSFVPTRHLAEIGTRAPDFVAVAERFLDVPYVWGGRTRLGLDCSGLVQTALAAAGVACPRDSDMQQAELGVPVSHRPDLGGLKRGDLVFWKGHVGILTRGDRLLHANAHHMAVVDEPLAAAIARIATSSGPVTAIKRLTGGQA